MKTRNRSKSLACPPVRMMLETCAMIGEIAGNPWNSLSNYTRSTVENHFYPMTENRKWTTISGHEPFEGKLLSRHGKKEKCAMYSLSPDALRWGILDEIEMDDYCRKYTRKSGSPSAGERERYRKLSNTVLGMENAGVRALPNSKPIPGLTADAQERFITPGCEWCFYTLKEVRMDLRESDRENVAYGKTLGVLCGPEKAFVVYGLLRKDLGYHVGAEERSVRLYERFLRKHSTGGYPSTIDSSIWLGNGMAPLSARLIEHEKGRGDIQLFGRVYNEDIYVPNGLLTVTIDMLARTGWVPANGIHTVDGAAQKFSDWRSEDGSWWLNGMTTDVSRLIRFRKLSRSETNETYRVICLPEQEDFYTKWLGESAGLRVLRYNS